MARFGTRGGTGGDSTSESSSDSSDDELEAESRSGPRRARQESDPNTGGSLPEDPTGGGSSSSSSETSRSGGAGGGGPMATGPGGQSSSLPEDPVSFGSSGSGGPDSELGGGLTDTPDFRQPGGGTTTQSQARASARGPSEGLPEAPSGGDDGTGFTREQQERAVDQYIENNPGLVLTGPDDTTGRFRRADITFRENSEGDPVVGPTESAVQRVSRRRASQSRSLGTTGTPTLAAGQRSQEAVRARETVNERVGSLIGDEDSLGSGVEGQIQRQRAAARDQVETRVGSLTDMDTPASGLEESLERQAEQATDGSTGPVEDPSAGPIANFARDVTGDPLAGFRQDVFSNRRRRESARADAVDTIESGLGFDVGDVIPGTAASRKARIDSAVSDTAGTTFTAATLIPRAVGGTIEANTDIDFSDEAGHLATGATLIPRVAAGAGATAARRQDVTPEGALATAAIAGVAAPEPVSTATGLAVLGGLTAAAGAGFVSESELGIGDTNQDVTELGVGATTQDTTELGVGATTQDTNELGVGETTQGTNELSIPEGTSVPAGRIQLSSQIGQEEFQPDFVIDEESITDFDIDEGRHRRVTGNPRIGETSGVPSSLYNPTSGEIPTDPVDAGFNTGREFFTGESAVVGRDTAQETVQDTAQDTASAEDTALDVETGLGSGQTTIPGLDTPTDTETPTDTTTPDVDVDNEFPTPNVTEPVGSRFGTPTTPEMGNPTLTPNVTEPVNIGLPGAPGVPTPPNVKLPDLGLGGDTKKRRRGRGGDFLKVFESDVATPQEVVGGDAASTPPDGLSNGTLSESADFDIPGDGGR